MTTTKTTTPLPGLTDPWHVKISTNDQPIANMLKQVMKACKVPRYEFPSSIKTFTHYAMVWNGFKMNDTTSSTPPGVALTVQEALQWLSAYVVPTKPKYTDVELNCDTEICYRSVRKLRAYRTGAQVLDLYEEKIGWMFAEDILACADAIKELQKA